MPERICEVNMYRGTGEFLGQDWTDGMHGPMSNVRSEKNKIGCFNPARWLNPFYDPEGTRFRSVWDDDSDVSLPITGGYNYAQWLCTEHYDEVIVMAKEDEEIDRVRRGIDED